MRRMLPIALIAFSLCAGYIARGIAAEVPGSQGRPIQAATPVKYAYIVGVGGRALICFAESAGCRMEAVTAEPVMMTAVGTTVLNASATQHAAMAKAVAQLGDAGWEMVGTGAAYGTATQDEAIHFKQVSR
jgi:hypothetical protein